ncbi:hypothetical protein GPECTOR_39g504 [Gonium pectorale]|uniref:Uncharacterized protein n=1 Tax=Gonium pectorale TaxID=33097 RepID=A0A150GCE9_GONPE|nr:hypothetical protein GPECTOR_39g504 [Gonium pectorale]|eukprot:KXZ47010.1 hypothetical protein GPECTOR_39g504 [Gonium pectorale]
MKGQQGAHAAGSIAWAAAVSAAAGAGGGVAASFKATTPLSAGRAAAAAAAMETAAAAAVASAPTTTLGLSRVLAPDSQPEPSTNGVLSAVGLESRVSVDVTVSSQVDALVPEEAAGWSGALHKQPSYSGWSCRLRA